MGIALLVLDYETRRHIRPAQLLALTAGGIAQVALIGYLYGVESLYSVGIYSSMALPTALGIAVLAIGLLCARPQHGIMEVVTSDTMGGVILRRFLPIVVAVLVLIGWLRLLGQLAGFYDTNFGLALMVMLSAAALTVVLWLNASWLNRIDTERKRAVESLDVNEERFRRFFENMHETFVVQEVVMDQAGKPVDLKFLDVNPAAERFLGKTRFELMGRTRTEVSGRPDPEGVEMAGRVASTGAPFHMVRYSPGFQGWFESFTYSLGSGMVATLSLDITERKQAEQALQKAHEDLELQVLERTAALSQANAFLQTMLDNMPDHIYFKDDKSRFIRNSKSQAKMMGLTDPAAAIGKSDFDFFPQEHAQRSYDEEQNLMKSDRPLMNVEERILWPDARVTWVSTTKLPLRDKNGRVVGTFGISRDITGRKQAEEELQRSNSQLEAANRELEAFAYSVSHDLRAPLRSIDGFSQAVMEDYGELLPEEGRVDLGRVRKAAQHMAQLIDDLLNLSRVTRAPMRSETVNLSEMAQGIITELQHGEPARSLNYIGEPKLIARGDSHLLQVVLENLLNNAWKFTSKRKQSKIELGSKHEKDETIYFVRDNGAGFDMAYTNKLFGAFQRLHTMADFPGTGVGLATVQRILHRHGGRIWAEAELEHGATFFFTVPALKRAESTTVPKDSDSILERAKEII